MRQNHTCFSFSYSDSNYPAARLCKRTRVKVLNKRNAVCFADIIAGIAAVYNYHEKRSRPGVVNLCIARVSHGSSGRPAVVRSRGCRKLTQRSQRFVDLSKLLSAATLCCNLKTIFTFHCGQRFVSIFFTIPKPHLQNLTLKTHLEGEYLSRAVCTVAKSTRALCEGWAFSRYGTVRYRFSNFEPGT